ncbi:DUF4142 domain-containing protein [Pontibacter sp. 172403-2]|uniref:DUF4142 domain-containing protein n=1 Tax=Pontibacter rufus TaxID=2791028 RepID=UPI0018AFC27B|nr:DUF4142 domain-containing protein [Pontibacter sp. 172403-2]MBF9251670.1 DUF4142 domain-containing protein [Pontibacter sp. 172403-2]
MKTRQSLTSWAVGTIACLALFAAPAAAQDSPKLSDAEVASVAVIANQIDIDQAELAKQKSRNEDVLQFAQTMASDHQAVIDQAAALVGKLGVTPQENAMGKQLQAAAEKTREMLRAKSGEAFDRAYVNNEVAYHKAVISAVEDLLIPETENPELKALLQTVVPALKEHLEHAQMLQKQLSGK